MLGKTLNKIIINLTKVILLVILTTSFSIFAAPAKKKKRYIPKPTQSSLVVDGKTGRVLHSHNANKKIYPASLTKVMTLYLIFESLDNGRLSLNKKLYVSKNATKALPSKLYLKTGERISVRDAILALTVKSANDVAKVVAENIAGSEKKFARLMTIRAKQLGMKNTNFTNASGWHDPKQVSTAVDLAKLSIAVKRDFPKYYHFFKRNSFVYKGKTIKGHNRVTENYPGAEGLKTGFHTPSGFNLITAATRGNKCLIGVITGGENSRTRDQKMISMLDTHFGLKKKHQKKKSNNKIKFAKKNKAKKRKT